MIFSQGQKQDSRPSEKFPLPLFEVTGYISCHDLAIHNAYGIFPFILQEMKHAN